MNKRDSNLRRLIFKEELHLLKEKQYIDELDYHKIHNAYHLYLDDEAKLQRLIDADLQQQEPVRTNPKPIKTKIVQTPEQIRERNISWALILGVILLFIGGLVFGTSNWSSMNNLIKVLFVSLVSIVFFASSYIADKYLNIKKTAFAFMTLGSLFLPVSIISIGFFELLGTWLSFYGEGKYLFGFIGSLICLPLYTYLAAKYKHRLFVWFTFLSATISIGFLLGMTYLPRDFFYLGIMIYNGLLLFAYHKLKNIEKFSLFTVELPVYAQLNLIISTLLMLFFFENALFYSFNILITAALYISMVFVNKTKHYHYIFTLLFVYGMYQLIENSFLQYINYIGFAFIGILYVIFQQYAHQKASIQRIFQITSAIVSFFAFIFISVQGLLLRSDEDSIVLCLAYVIISINYMYLAYIAKLPIFRYLAPIFLMIAGLQSYFILFKGHDGTYLELYLFIIATFMYTVFYLKNSFLFTRPITKSSFIVSIGTMLLTILMAVGSEEFTHASILLLAFGFIALITYKHTQNGTLKKVSSWANPISWGLSWMSIFDYLAQHSVFYRYHVEIMGHLAIGGLILLGFSYFWKSRKQWTLDLSTFLIALSVYTLSMLSTPLGWHDHPVMSSLILLVGIYLYILLVYKMKLPCLWTLVSITSIAFLSSLAHVFKLENNNTLAVIHFLLIPIILLGVYEFIGRKVQELKPYFFWSAHAFLVPVFFVSTFYVIISTLQPMILLFALLPYIYSTLKQTKEWEIKIFLYAAFTTLPFIVYLNIRYYNLDSILTGEHLFLIVTGIIAILWLSVNETWKKRIDWYAIPQSILGLLIFIFLVNDLSIINMVLFILDTIFILFLLHRRKWTLYTIIPLSFSTIFFLENLAYMEKHLQVGFILILFFVLHVFGNRTNKQLISSKTKPISIDWYTITSCSYIIMLFVIISNHDPLWLKLIPALLVVYFLYTLINRFITILEKLIVKTITAVSILLPYYVTLAEFEWNPYIKTEMYVLPFIVLTILLSTYVLTIY